MKVAMHQSQYLPWPPLIKKIAGVDLFIVMDSVQYQKNGVQNRNQICNSNGAFWITIPVTGPSTATIAEKRIADQQWRRKHLLSIAQSYSRTPRWNELESMLTPLYEQEFETLGSANDTFLEAVLQRCRVATEVRPLSGVGAVGSKSDLVLDACTRVGATTYVAGHGALDYLDVESFARAGIEVQIEPSVPPVYDQGREVFIEGLSIVDMLAHVSDDQLADYLEAT